MINIEALKVFKCAIYKKKKNRRVVYEFIVCSIDLSVFTSVFITRLYLYTRHCIIKFLSCFLCLKNRLCLFTIHALRKKYINIYNLNKFIIKTCY